MNYTKDKLLKVARHWEGLSLNDRLANKNPTPMITIEVPVVVWDKIWEDDAAPDMHQKGRKALAWMHCQLVSANEVTDFDREVYNELAKSLAKAEGKEGSNG